LWILLIIIISGCSTQKNTWLTRYYHATNTRFNVRFNGQESYDEGLKNIQKANQEDYTTVIPMYPISRHSNATAATSNMDRTIEKCRKAIKLHSIKKRPERNLKKGNSPEYLLFYNQEEFNPALKTAWLLLAKAEFHKGEFLASVGTFSYVARHYATDVDVVAQCQLWTARAYGEMGWIYEAEQVLSKLDQDKLKLSHIGLFASVNADILLKRHQYKEAIPFLQIALEKEKDKYSQQRFSYLLAQLYQKNGDDKTAYEYFSKVIKSNPSYEMDFNARISQAQLNHGNVSGVRKSLKKMLRDPNNKEYLDQLYYTIGNSYLHHGDTLKALENFRLSAEKSTRNGIDKAITLITLGDLHYLNRNYVKAQPCYDEASKLITVENENYSRVSKRAETLSELVIQNNIVLLQDSLQALALLPESKRLEVVNKLIEKLIADEKLAAENTLTNTENRKEEEDFASLPPIGGNSLRGTADWYFYNPLLMRTGQTEFQKSWGKRKLEDNWRRTNKAVSLFAEENSEPAALTDTTSTKQQTEAVADNKKPEFYLNQIPVTAAQMVKSNAELATAMFNLGLAYKDKVEDIPMAISTFEEFIRRFGSDERKPDAYFQIYLMETKRENQTEANLYRTKLINEFPRTKYAKILSQPDYTGQLTRMYREQDSIYNLTYKAYIESDFNEVFKNKTYVQQNYPLSTLMPKFLFLNALSIGKTGSQERFGTALNELVTTYPESDVSAMAKDILALMKQGQEAKTGTSQGTLLTRLDVDIKPGTNNDITAQQFSAEKQSKHRMLLISPANTTDMNRLMYQIASFNFSRFMIKDFDLVNSKLDSTQNVLSITNFESYEEAIWYENSLASDASLTQLLKDLQVKKVIISEDNYALLRTTYSLNDYLVFLSKPQVAKQALPVAIIKPIKKQESVAIVTNKPAKTEPVIPLKTKELSTEKPAEKKKEETTPAQTVTKQQETVTKPVQTPVTVQTPVIVQPKVEEVPLFKNLFAYRVNEPHFIAIYIVSGTIDFEKTKAAFDTYNGQNYGLMNLKVSLETTGKQQVIIIGSLSDANVAKSYLLRMVKEKSLFEGLKGASYRNLLGSQKNLNTLIQQNALNVYFEFMQEYYLK